MTPRTNIFAAVARSADNHRDEMIGLLQKLVRIPSVNRPPTGDEKEVQAFYAECLRSLGLETDVFEAHEVPTFKDHPGRLKDHDMSGRPNVVGILSGAGEGRSLMLLAHADVEVPGESSHWIDGDPFSGTLRDGKVYGRGTGDDKSGMVVNAMVPRILNDAGVRLKGDLLIGSLSDEEQGGSNGAVALLAKGYRADAAIYHDGNNQDICTSNLGGGYVVIDLELAYPQEDAVRLLTYFDKIRGQIDDFRKERSAEFDSHPHYRTSLYRDSTVRLVDIRLATSEANYGCGSCKVWFYLLPGETPRGFQNRFASLMETVMSEEDRYNLTWMPRFVLPSQVAENHRFVRSFKSAFARATGRKPSAAGSFMSDMGFVNNYGGFPCLIFGAGRWGRDGAPHQPNECVDVREMMECLKTVLFCALGWCGYEDIGPGRGAR